MTGILNLLGVGEGGNEDGMVALSNSLPIPT